MPEPGGRAPARVTLVDVDEDVLARLLRVAVEDADPDEVTPPLAPGWAPQRRDWFLAYHRACRAGSAGADGVGGFAGVGGVGGFAGERRERTWAVVVGGEPVGAVRLAVVDPTAEPAADPADGGGTHPPADVPLTVETGIWLARAARGGGVGTVALAAVLDHARALGVRRVVADTAATNLAAQAAVRRLGFALTTHGDRVRAVLDV